MWRWQHDNLNLETCRGLWKASTSQVSQKTLWSTAPLKIDLLGGTAKGVSFAVHAETWAALVEAELLPAKMPAQRNRAIMTKGTAYAAPACFMEDFNKGHIHPDVPAPEGLEWMMMVGGKQLSLIQC